MHEVNVISITRDLKSYNWQMLCIRKTLKYKNLGNIFVLFKATKMVKIPSLLLLVTFTGYYCACPTLKPSAVSI